MKRLVLLSMLAGSAYAGTVSATLTGTASGSYSCSYVDPAAPCQHIDNQPFSLYMYGTSDAFQDGDHDDKPAILGGSLRFGDINQPLATFPGEPQYDFTLDTGEVLGLFQGNGLYSMISFGSDQLIGYNYDHSVSLTGLSPWANPAGDGYAMLPLQNSYLYFNSFGSDASLCVTYTPEYVPEPGAGMLVGLASVLFATFTWISNRRRTARRTRYSLTDCKLPS